MRHIVKAALAVVIVFYFGVACGTDKSGGAPTDAGGAAASDASVDGDATAAAADGDATAAAADGAEHHDGAAHADAEEHGEDGHTHGTGTLGTHIHMIDFWGADNAEIALGTHTGVYRTQSGSSELKHVGEKADFMGFVRDPFHPNTYWGSGHNPAAGLNNWGFVESLDAGVTWQVKSLSGTSDFHQMDASTTTENLVGGTWGSKLWVSTTAGKDWKNFPWPKAATGVLFEDATSVLLASQTAGIERVAIPSMTATSLHKGGVSGMCRHGKGVMYGTYSGKLYVCDKDAKSCTSMKGPGPQRMVQCLVDPANPTRMYVLISNSEVHHSDDGGKTWSLVATTK